MLLNSLKGIAFVTITAVLMLAVSLAFRTIPGVGKINLLGMDLAFVIGLLIAIPLAQTVFRRISWLRFRGL